MKKCFRWIVTFAFVMLSACSQSENPPETAKYMKTFAHIHTNQYLWTYGSGGIYWVSDDHVLLEAHIKNSKGALDRGLYQVDINDGSYLKIVDVPDDSPISYKYCFDGAVLNVMVGRGDFLVENVPGQYMVEMNPLGKKTRSNRYSGLRCEFVELPKEEKVAYIPLRKGDGYIKNQAGKEKSDPIKAFVVDEQGNIVEELTDSLLDSLGVIGVRRFISHSDAYFGYSFRTQGCAVITLLFRDPWKLEQQEICFNGWAEGGSVLPHKLRDALYIEHYLSRDSKSYIFDGERTLVDRGFIRGASVSPNGCFVAYGEGRIGRPQHLKIFRYCDFQGRKDNYDDGNGFSDRF